LKYDIDYYENMLRIYSKTAETISRIRWEWIGEVSPKKVLDYGSGVGWFRAFRPEGVYVDSMDIGPYPQKGISCEHYDVVCFHDVLEHMKSFDEVKRIFETATYVAGTIPVVPANKDVTVWKHYKPGEHLRYWSEESFEADMSSEGFKKVKHGMPECPPRTDILSFLYKKWGR